MFLAILVLAISIGDAGPSHIGGPPAGRQANGLQRGMPIEEVSRVLREAPKLLITVRSPFGRVDASYEFPTAEVEVRFIDDRLYRVVRMKR